MYSVFKNRDRFSVAKLMNFFSKRTQILVQFPVSKKIENIFITFLGGGVSDPKVIKIPFFNPSLIKTIGSNGGHAMKLLEK